MREPNTDYSAARVPQRNRFLAAFERLDRSPVWTIEQKGLLELAFLESLAPGFPRDTGSIPNLERYVSEHPELFVRAVCLAYRRRDRGVDPHELQAPDGRKKALAERSNLLLEALRRVPGQKEDGSIGAEHLAGWVNSVRASSEQLSRLEMADLCIGKLLSHAPVGSDGVWPCEPVRDVLENVQSEELLSGVTTGVFNGRGVVLRGADGEQERELARKYRGWADALRVSHPFVAAKLLDELERTYSREGDREDTWARLQHRLHGD
jgi:hypothetical protein